MQTKLKHRLVAPVVAGVLAGGALLAGASDASATVPDLREGSTGNGVWCAQIAVNVALHPSGSGEIAEDKDFGPKTLAAVEQYQRSVGISADGIIGPQTGSYMLSDIAYRDDFNLANWCSQYVPGAIWIPTSF